MRIGVDLGGTKIEAIAVDDDGTTLLRRRVPTPVSDYPATLVAICDLVRDLEGSLSREGSVGLGSPGSLSLKTGRLKNANSTVLNGKALDCDISARLDRPIRLENDANCFALSEAVDGAARHCEVVFGVILGTGVGGGLVIRRQVLTGRNRIAGEWGHNPLPWPRDDERPGPRCYCGNYGCIETFISGPALARQYELLTRQRLTARQVSEAAQEGDAAAAECLSIYEDRLSRSLASVVNVVDPDAIVLGGGLSNIKRLYVGLQPSIKRLFFPIPSPPKYFRPRMVILAVFVARLGSGQFLHRQGC